LYCFDSRNLTFTQALAQFKFVLSIENARTLDYVTEKFWQPLLAGRTGACVRVRNDLTLSPGCVPVYVGAPNIDDIAPRGSFINANNLTSTEIAAEIAKYLSDSNA
jgi:alpha-1,3-fucosyltransferase 10